MTRRVDVAEFVISAVSARDLPRDGRPEIAMVGRSNVGKSTLINALVRKDVARTSSSPGRTRQANVYRIGAGRPGTRLHTSTFYLVDLPGYGHAGGGEKAQREFAAIVAEYFESRAGDSPLAGCLLAVDARHPGLASDLDAMRWLARLAVPTLVVATKADKLSQSDRTRLRREGERTFGGPLLVVSAIEGDGLDDLWRQVTTWCLLDQEPGTRGEGLEG
jgi:GTP-binding protein